MDEFKKWDRMCLSKKKYSEETADMVIMKVHNERGADVRKYFCPYCFHWHLTKQPLTTEKVTA